MKFISISVFVILFFPSYIQAVDECSMNFSGARIRVVGNRHHEKIKKDLNTKLMIALNTFQKELSDGKEPDPKPIMDLIFVQNADPHTVSTEDKTALMLFIEAEYDRGVQSLASLNDFNINWKNYKGLTAVSYAISVKNLKILSYLLEAGANPNEGLTNEGDTPLISASTAGYIDGVKALIEDQSVEVNKTTKTNMTALMLVSFFTSSIYNKIASILVNHPKTDLNVRDSITGQTALMIAAASGSLLTARALIRGGAKLNLSNKKRQTAASIAKENKHLKVEQLITESGGVHLSLVPVYDNY